MKSFCWLFLSFCLIFFGFGTPISDVFGKGKIPATAQYQTVPGLAIVKFAAHEKTTALKGVHTFSAAGVASIDAKMQKFSVIKAEKLFADAESPVDPRKVDLSKVYRIYFPESIDPHQVANEFANDPLVEYAEPVYLIPLDKVPNDPNFPAQQHLPQIFAPEAWDLVKGDSTIIVGIVDSGVDYDHPDLADNIWMNADEVLDGKDTDGNGYVDDIRGWDFVNGVTNAAPGEDANVADNDPMDFGGHGTNVAGCVSAVTNNGIGVAAISWNCKLMALRVGWQPAAGLGLVRSDWSALAFRYAADNGAHVVNLSAGNNQVVADAGRYAFEKGVVVVTSAGNGNINTTDSPLNTATFALTVAALDNRDRKASYSSFGPWVKVSAPGGDINAGRPGILTTAFNDIYERVQGTSFSSPITAGLAALLKSQHPDWGPDDIVIQIVETADNIDALNPGFEGQLGGGRINAFRAVTEQVVAKPRLNITKIKVDDSLTGNNNGSLDPGEDIQVRIEFENVWADVSNLQAILSSDDYAIQVTQSSAVYPQIPGLSDLNNNKAMNATPFEVSVLAEALPHRARFQLTLTSATGYSETMVFSLAISPNVLLVDDDDNDNNVESYYTTVLDSLGISFDIWNRSTQGTVGLNRLMNYPVVIWLCEWTFPSLDADDRADLEFYLLAGGNLFLSGQDIGWDLSDGASGNENEFSRSQGLSKQFYETVLHASYIKDDSDFNSVTGIQGNPIGAGLRFTIRQPGRDDDQQFPSEILPLDGAVSIFNYSNGNSGAVMYSGIYRLVYFAFGGYEAIVDDQVRFEVMNRVMKWFGGIDLELTEWSDTENITSDYRVEAIVSSAVSPLTQVELYWDTDGLFPFQKVAMTDLGGGKYQAFIPAQKDAQIQYFVYARNQAGFYTPTRLYSFFAGADQKPPMIEEVTLIADQLSNSGPFPVAFTAVDNIGLDTTYAFVHFFSPSTPMDSARLVFQDQRFTGWIPSHFGIGDTVQYYVSTRDRSQNKNIGKSALYSFQVGREGFENGLAEWATSDSSGWVWDAVPHTGNFNLRWLPRQYQAGQEALITLQKPIWLADLEHATLRYWYFHLTRPSDYVVVEASSDSGQTWIAISKQYSGTKINKPTDKYLEELISLDSFIQAGTKKLWLQLHYVIGAGAPLPANGFYLDDMEILLQPTGIADEVVQPLLPAEFGLAQNYPNPFNASTRIRYRLAEKSRVIITIYNTLGQEINELVNQVQEPGDLAVDWHGTNRAGQMVPSGLYLYQIQAGNYTATRKLLLLK